MQDLIAALVAFFLIEPLQADLAERLNAVRAPQAMVAELTTCVRTATPVVVDRAASDPWWAASSSVGLWAGWVRPETLLVDLSPDCTRALEAAYPLLADDTRDGQNEAV